MGVVMAPLLLTLLMASPHIAIFGQRAEPLKLSHHLMPVLVLSQLQQLVDVSLLETSRSPNQQLFLPVQV